MKELFKLFKSKRLSFTLTICSIPIGDQDDITLNVRSCLKRVATIFCEDTRIAKQFLIDQGIWLKQELIRMDQFQEKKSFRLFDQYINVHDVAYMTDAGSPAISDPGALLVDHARSSNIKIRVLGGVSALTVFLSGAGILTSEFYFGGFFPKKDGEIDRLLSFVTQFKMVGVWFDSPKRIVNSFEKISLAFPNIKVVVAKELSKTYELFLTGEAHDVYNRLCQLDTRGEWVFLLDARHIQIDQNAQYLQLAVDLKAIGVNSKQVKQLASLFDLNKNDLYDKFQQL